MISNYLKLAWRLLARRKFFTIISLFGISFTLGILMVILSFLQSELGSAKPMTFKEDLILLENLRLQTVIYDTLTTIDTIVENQLTTYDTSYTYERRGAMMWNSSMNNGIAEDYLSDIKSVETMTIFSEDISFDVYVNNVKVNLNFLYGDPSYFEVFDYEILEGRVLDQNDFDAAAQVVVISTKTALEYFGRASAVVGEEMEVDGKTFTVIGLYKHRGKIRTFISPSAVAPYSLVNEEDQPTFYHGFYTTIFKKKAEVSMAKVKQDIEARADLIPLDHPTKPEGFEEVILYPTSYDEMIAQGIYDDEEEEKSYAVMKWILFSLLLFFIILPTLNLINLNVSRILERSSEIGVRKAFGASHYNILLQFIIENIVLTILGGILGLLLAILCINAINRGGYMGESILYLSPKFFLYCFLATLIFGIVSGLLPAYRMSKLQIVQSLKQAKL